MKLSIKGSSFYLGGVPTYTRRTGFPDADPRVAGLLLNHRVINGIFDDLAGDPSAWAYSDTGEWDPERNVDKFVMAMEYWREHGVIAFTIGLQGGNPHVYKHLAPEGFSREQVDSGAFEPDGSLRPAFMARLGRILDRAVELDMVPIVNYFYQGGNRRIAEDALETAVDNATNWLLEAGYDGLIIDLANECDVEPYWPALQLPNIHELIYRVKDTVDLYSNRTGKGRRFYVGASFGGTFSVSENLAQVPAEFIRAVDLLLPHGNSRSTEEVEAAIEALCQRILQVANKALPIVYNEDIAPVPPGDEGDMGGDLAHLDACLEAHVSWGNLIRSHQRVPCANWVTGSDAQAAWFAKTRELAGAPTPPSSVRHLSRRIHGRFSTAGDSGR